jgi:hypothetical protein
VNSSNKDSNHNKGDIINVTKAAASKSILMQTTKVRAANGFHWTNRQGSHINVNKIYLIHWNMAGKLTYPKRLFCPSGISVSTHSKASNRRDLVSNTSQDH